jgi:hypothetical protein
MLREEGEFWNAYLGDGPNDAIHLGSIRMAIVQKSEAHKRAFMDLMSGAVSDYIEAIFGERPTMDERAAPEHERSGRA